MVSPASTVGSSIPELWAAELQVALRKALRYANVCNRKYEGEVKRQGASVRITTVADVPITSYSRNTDITLNTLTTTDQNLVVDQAKAYGFFWDALDQTQTATKGIMQEAISRAAYNLRDTMDSFVASTLDDGVATANDLADATSVGSGAGDDDPFKILVRLAQILGQNNVPDDAEMWVVVPYWYAAELKIDPRNSSFGTPANRELYGNGLLGLDSASGLNIWVSNNVPTTDSDPQVGQFSVIAGYMDSITLAEQMTEFAVKDNPYRFGSNCLGMHVYGAKVTRPYTLAKVLATQAA
jgi:hypothetical protein